MFDHSKGLDYGGGCAGFYGTGMVMDGRNGGDGFVKKMKMKVVENGDTCDEVVQNGFVGGHSTFDIHFSGQMNLPP